MDMNFLTVFAIAAETLIATFLIWGIFHEKQLIAFERRTAKRIQKKMRLIKARRAAKRHVKQNRAAVYRPVLPEKKRAGNRVA